VDDLSKNVPGHTELAKFWGGEFPSFHDSEIIALQLHRTETSHISLRLVGRRREQKEDGVERWVPIENVIVTFFLDGVEDLELYGFSIQNVISGLALESTESGFRLKLWPCYGLAGWLTAERVRIEFSPGQATG
jgi:hypothetical protein